MRNDAKESDDKAFALAVIVAALLSVLMQSKMDTGELIPAAIQRAIAHITK